VSLGCATAFARAAALRTAQPRTVFDQTDVDVIEMKRQREAESRRPIEMSAAGRCVAV
jgi:hypothetical protein